MPSNGPRNEITLNVSLLEAVRERKAMYLDPFTVESCQNFLDGFSLACFACGIVDASERILAGQAGRGWTVEACGPVPEMRERGLSDEQIMDELITIHIAAFRDENEDDAGSLSRLPLDELS